MLLDNAKPLVNFHDAQTREVRFNDRFHAFCRYWDVLPKACAPYRARTKGKDERGVGYVKRNAIAALRPLEGRTTFQPLRECVRRVHADACVELETNRYSVPWRLIGEAVTMLVNEQVRILHAGQEVAIHTRLAGQRRASIQREHLLGIVGSEPRPQPSAIKLVPGTLSELLRALQE